MATRYAVANGNWSATATWNGGTLPTSADDVYANNFTVTIDQDVTVLSLRNAAVASPVITAGGTFQAQTSGTRIVSANVVSAANGSVVTIPAGTVNFTLNGNITGGTNANSTFTMGTYTFVNANLSSYPTVTINGNITAGSVTSHNALRHGGGTLYVTGTVTGGSGGSGTSCYGIEVFNSNNVPSYTEIKTGSSLVGGTNTAGSTAALAVTYSPTGSSITPSSTIINCNLTGGASGSGGFGNAAYNHSSNSIPCTITGNATGALANRAINISGSADITIIGHVFAASTGAGGSQAEAAVVHNGVGLLTVTGNLYGSTSGTGTSSSALYLQGAGAKYSQTGNIIGGTSTSQSYALWSGNSGQTITITGNVTGGSGANSWGFRNNNTSNMTINGNVTGGSGSTGYGGQPENASSVITVNGTATGGTGGGSHGIFSTGGATMIVTRLKGNDGGLGSVGIVGSGYAVMCNVLSTIIRFKELEFGALGNSPLGSFGTFQLVDDPTNVSIFRTSSSTFKTLTDPNATATYPTPANVRSGISYASGNYTGTLAVPAAGSVALGVAVDNTTGTAVLTPAAVWSYSLATAAGTSGSVGEKLKKTSNTVDLIALG